MAIKKVVFPVNNLRELSENTHYQAGLAGGISLYDAFKASTSF